MNNQTKNLVQGDKHNPQAKTLVLNWHNQNPNITTVEMLKVLQWENLVICDSNGYVIMSVACIHKHIGP